MVRIVSVALCLGRPPAPAVVPAPCQSNESCSADAVCVDGRCLGTDEVRRRIQAFRAPTDRAASIRAWYDRRRDLRGYTLLAGLGLGASLAVSASLISTARGWDTMLAGVGVGAGGILLFVPLTIVSGHRLRMHARWGRRLGYLPPRRGRRAPSAAW